MSATCPFIRSNGKFDPVHVMKACGGIVSLICSISTR